MSVTLMLDSLVSKPLLVLITEYTALPQLGKVLFVSPGLALPYTSMCVYFTLILLGHFSTNLAISSLLR